jgi:DNA-binding NtrC family response regulator
MQNRYRILVIDDDPIVRDSFSDLLDESWTCTAMEAPSGRSPLGYHCIIIDMHFGEVTEEAAGLRYIKTLSELYPHAEIIAMSGDLSLSLMEKAISCGAKKFLAKPISQPELKHLLSKVKTQWSFKFAELSNLKNQSIKWVGSGDESKKIKLQIANLKSENGPILIEGETGTGKEVVTQLLHRQEGIRPLIAVNVAGISENLFESEMFGHIKGSFTGAEQNKVGLTEAAGGGDLFLDEIEALSQVNQVKLLRFLESFEVKKVGSKDTIKVNCRVIAASNVKLDELVRKNLFRADLLFRLKSQHIFLAPLRERSEDLKELCEFFLNQMKPRYNKFFTEEALDFLRTYHWPGNVRELKRVIEQVCLQAPLPAIRKDDLLFLKNQEDSSSEDDLSEGLMKLLEQYEKKIIEKSIKQTKNFEEACDLLKISRSSFYKKVKDYQIQ